MSVGTAFDLGPLTWVKGEIDLALDRALQALQQFGTNPADATQAKFCRTHLHQVRGALAMVGLDGVTHFSDALEALLRDLEEQRQPADSAHLTLIGRALTSIRHYLEDLIAGEPNQPLRLLDLYRQIAAARGLPAVSPSDLFFPDLSQRPPLPPLPAPTADEAANRLRAGRGRFQKGMLAWLKNPADAAGAEECRTGAGLIGNASAAPVLRSFWWSVGALFTALAERAVPLEAEIKPLLARIDQQTRQQLEGSRTVPERLMRDVLFYVAIARTQRPEVQAVRQAWALEALIPGDNRPTSATSQVEPLVKRLRDLTRGTEDAWNKFCGGTAAALANFRELAASLHQGAEQIGHADLHRLTHMLAAIGDWVSEQSSRHNDVVAMETATAVILIGDALDNFTHLGPDFVHQVDVMVARLQTCVDGTPLPPDAEVPQLDEMTRRAQEKLLIAQVVREIQSNLGQIEQALDTFFREPEQTAQLAACQRPLYQIAGALSILRQDPAVSALMATGGQIARFAQPGYQVKAADFEAVASQLSALGFFVEALRSGSPDYNDFVRKLNERPGRGKPRPEDGFAAHQAAATGAPAVTVPAVAAAEAAVDIAPPRLPEEPSPPAPAESRSPLPAAAPALPAAPVAPEVDAELLEIFLEEAHEVLGTIAENLDQLKAQPSNSESLTTIRRAFHTLKGSSRMVGLKDFGEVAWVVEQVHNLWLRQERPAGAELFKLIALAHEVFAAWVARLTSGSSALPDASPLVALAESMKGGETVTLTPAAPKATPPEPAEAPAEAPLVELKISLAEDAAPSIELSLAPEPAADDGQAVPDAEAAPVLLELPAADEQAAALEFATDGEIGDGTIAAGDAPPVMDDADDALVISSIELAPLAGEGDFGASSVIAPDAGEASLAAGTIGDEEQFPPLELPTLTHEEVAVEPTLLDAAAPGLAEESAVLELPTLADELSLGAEELPVVAEPAVPPEANELVLDEVIALDQELPEIEAHDATPEEVAPSVVAADLPESSAPTEEPAGLRQQIIVSPVLYQIFLEEAQEHLAALQRSFGEIELEPALPTPTEMIRAAHTLGSIAGTVGFQPILKLGHALEAALNRRDLAAQPDSLEALETVRQAIAELEQLVATVADNGNPGDTTSLVGSLVEIYPAAAFTVAADAPPIEMPAMVFPREDELPADHLDADLLPIFLEEASDLVEGGNERLSMWFASPADHDTIHALARLLHTLKGSARMAGALRVGALTHALEAEVEVAQHAGGAHPERIALLQAQFDEIAEGIAALRLPQAAAAPPEATEEIAGPADETVPAAATAPETGEVPLPDNVMPLFGRAAVSGEIPSPSPLLEAASTPLPEDQLDDQLLPIFLEESTELVKTVYDQLALWHAAPNDHAAEHSLARALHTLKGSARMAGAMSLGALTHTLETRVEDIARAEFPDPHLINEIRGAFDTIAHVIERLQHGESLSGMTVELPAATPAPDSAATAEPAAPVAAPAPALAAAGAAKAPAKDAEQGPRPMLRVRADMIDRLVNDAGELSIARARIEGEMRGLKQAMLDLTENVIRLRRQLREIEIQAETQMQSQIAHAQETSASFDPLELDRFTRFQELTRMMAESVNDVATVQQTLLKSLDQSNSALAAQARLNRELQQELMSVRMVPFQSIVERLYRIVRQTSKEVGKRADMEVAGSQVELDQNIINKMIGPLEHLLRNAVSHGLEGPAERLAAGKPEIGEVRLSLKQEGNEVIIAMRDDGAGLNYARIRAKAIAHGLLGADEDASERQLVDMIFKSGFSTANEVTQLAGRGVGMDVVRTEVSNLGGRIEVQSETGRGTTFRIYLPLTLAVTSALLVRVGSRTFAVPSTMIDQVQELKEAPLATIREAGISTWHGNDYPFHFLPHLLGDPGALPEARKMYWVLHLHSGTQRVAVQVDELLGTHEVVVKNIGPQLARVVGIAGATVLGDGRVVLILNPVALATRAPAIDVIVSSAALPAPVAPAVAHLPTVLVVDDSLTVRKITSRLLAREGYQVLTAKDGVDALEQMTEFTPDVILSDIEMPRMDGFELARNIRGDERLRDVPIIMITSRTADKHRSHASELGVDHFLGKPYQEDDLLRLVGDYVAQKRA